MEESERVERNTFIGDIDSRFEEKCTQFVEKCQEYQKNIDEILYKPFAHDQLKKHQAELEKGQ